ncbi:hypothetical protein CRE_10429 [Caenorhabditis remanei]|uniref:F-box domain-containing protein n=1 Tax=Caenorhabditis remanei TaxID=31234 RepID=E3N0U0_CAERE|nr:hypothetical protein CRE_10429 [Caenorhabditis remanei]
MTTAFPLLRLPHLVLMPILEQMEFMESIALSVLSKRARMFVKLLKMKCEHINLKLIGDRLEMTVVFNNRRIYVDINTDKKQPADLKYRDDYIRWWPGLPVPIHYALPIIDVTHCQSIKQLTLDRVYEYDPSPLFAKLPRIGEFIVEDNFWTRDIVQQKIKLQKLLKIVLPISSAVTISSHILNPEDLREIIRGKFESVTVRKYRIDNMPNRDMKFSLNDLKMTNVKSLELAHPVFTLEDLNRYFKLWMRKKCNPRLEYLRVWQNGSVNKDLLLDGLNAVQMPIRTDRTFRVLGNVIKLGSFEEITAQFDITRVDGKTATIRISTYGTVSFYVWPESTNDTTNHEPNQSSLTRKFSWLSIFYNSCIDRFK